MPRLARDTPDIPAENVQLARNILETLNSDGYEAILDFIHPEFEGVTPPELSVEPDTYRGLAGVRRYFESFADVMDELRFPADEFVDAGDGRVVVLGRLSARSLETGLRLDLPVAQVWMFRDGLLAGLDAYATPEEALQSVRLES